MIRAAAHFRLNQEIKLLHIKKVKLNEQLYYKHLECTALRPSYWQFILNLINDSLQWEMETHYDRLNKKLYKLQEKQNTSTHKPQGRHPTACPRIVNLTNIQFTVKEQKLLDLGLQYSMWRLTTTTWTNLVLETVHHKTSR
jgi:hypothetical protein